MSNQRRFVVIAGIGIGLVLAWMMAFDIGPFASPTERAAVAPAQPAQTTPRVQANTGLAVGRVAANNGAVLTVNGVLGGPTVVHTNTATKVFVLRGTKVSSVAVGDRVIVFGDKKSDGSVIAKMIVGG
ncbi:hypothetical protein ACFVMC_29060 [Nocardia sp. NPDC127579]|uniref:hypothetical protein n=1 Tax=Nocardia sp. NPDC127579 TaxID=3345402 RepID=UPI00362F9ABF